MLIIVSVVRLTKGYHNCKAHTYSECLLSILLLRLKEVDRESGTGVRVVLIKSSWVNYKQNQLLITWDWLIKIVWDKL